MVVTSRGQLLMSRRSTLMTLQTDEIGTPMEIVNLFGSKNQYMMAITNLEQAIYSAA